MENIRHRFQQTRSDLGWRLPLYRSYLFYLRTCRNWLDVIRYEQSRRFFDRFEMRNGMVIRFRNPSDALIMLKDLWWERVYTNHYQDSAPRTVVDVGANVGFFTLYAKKTWPACRILAIEPESENCALLQLNIAESRVANVALLNEAVAAYRGSGELVLARASGEHALDQSGQATRSVPVATVDLEQVIESSGGQIDFLKLDCEGGEWAFLEGKEKLLQEHVSYIAMEYHERGGKRREDMIALLERAGFSTSSSPPDAWKNGMLYASNQLSDSGS